MSISVGDVVCAVPARAMGWACWGMLGHDGACWGTMGHAGARWHPARWMELKQVEALPELQEDWVSHALPPSLPLLW